MTESLPTEADLDTAPVDDALNQLRDLNQEDSASYVGVYENIHDVLREFLDGSPAS